MFISNPLSETFIHLKYFRNAASRAEHGHQLFDHFKDAPHHRYVQNKQNFALVTNIALTMKILNKTDLDRRKKSMIWFK